MVVKRSFEYWKHVVDRCAHWFVYTLDDIIGRFLTVLIYMIAILVILLPLGLVAMILEIPFLIVLLPYRIIRYLITGKKYNEK
jgi:hypothetical protein